MVNGRGKHFNRSTIPMTTGMSNLAHTSGRSVNFRFIHRECFFPFFAGWSAETKEFCRIVRLTEEPFYLLAHSLLSVRMDYAHVLKHRPIPSKTRNEKSLWNHTFWPQNGLRCHKFGCSGCVWSSEHSPDVDTARALVDAPHPIRQIQYCINEINARQRTI